MISLLFSIIGITLPRKFTLSSCHKPRVIQCINRPIVHFCVKDDNLNAAFNSKSLISKFICMTMGYSFCESALQDNSQRKISVGGYFEQWLKNSIKSTGFFSCILFQRIISFT